MSGLSFTLAGRRVRTAAVVFSAGLLALVAGCSAGATSSTGASAKPTSPRTALLLAAEQTRQLDTMAASYTAQTNGSQTLASTILVQYKPALLIEAVARRVYIESPTLDNGIPLQAFCPDDFGIRHQYQKCGRAAFRFSLTGLRDH